MGDHFQVLKVSEWVEDHFQVLKVSEGTCTVLGDQYTVPTSSVQQRDIVNTLRHLKDKEVVPHPFWHLKALEVVPHPRREMLSSMNSSNKQINRKWEKTQKPKIRLVIYLICSLVYQKSNMILWSIRTFWYKGSAENKGKTNVRKKDYISQKQQPKTQSMIFHKSPDMV